MVMSTGAVHVTVLQFHAGGVTHAGHLDLEVQRLAG
jgi:hypothetical protein